ncbi:serine hydrolase domain-containing protein [Enterococcus rivorum]|uniref:Serine hydrolase n=3 Tax=Enterococcus rivorum TaxID=762845 RepID=A0A1E5KT76_9ENTE|nr:serine hydrolase [Enterococcus rivorum]MBP2098116.1 CubicO group peptidase (beta-lactamase class C family) [Enterococcus rivorum]OEH81053.1 serine hydrolase [Enterococcus rivorum]
MNKKRLLLLSISGLVIIIFFIFYFTKEQLGSAEKQASESKKTVISWVDKKIADEHFKGSLLLVKNQEIFYKQSYGYSNNAEKIENNLSTSYPIASLQKFITGIVILQLIQEKKLNENTSLKEFYPAIKDSEAITIRQLLNHTSGIVMDEMEPPVLLITQEEQMDYTLDHLEVSYKKDFYYSNANYTLLSGIISKVLKSDYETVVQKRIIEKLDLKNTFFWDTLPKNQESPTPYQYQRKDYQTDDFLNSDKLFSSLLGAGNMFMSVEDMWQVQKGLTDGRLFSATEYNDLANSELGEYQAGFFYFDGLKYSEGNLGGYDTVIYGKKNEQDLVILFANQPAENGMGNLAEQLYNRISSY